MPFDIAKLDDFMPMDHKTVQPIAAKALKCYDEAGTPIPGYHHIVRGDTGQTIRVAPDSYPIVQNDIIVEMIETALAKSKLDLTDARFGVDYSHDGARMFAQWLLPAHTAKVRPGVEASLRVIVLNSYDASTALHGRIGSFNWACANQAVSGKEYASFRFAHSGKIDLEPAITRLTGAAEEHVEQVHRWEHWPNIPVSNQLARKVLTAMPKATESQVDALVHAWVKAVDEDPVQGGPNLWCLYSVLTQWATHGEGGGENVAFRNWERHERIATMIDGAIWKEVEKAGAPA
jgi:Domain of unknown function (DUF932)